MGNPGHSASAAGLAHALSYSTAIPGVDLTLSIALDVVAGIEGEVRDQASGVPEYRGGVLLGRGDSTGGSTISIEGYEAAAAPTPAGRTLATEALLATRAGRVSGDLSPVGVYRISRRCEAAVSDQERGLLMRYFSDAPALLVLLNASDGWRTAAVFVSFGGRINQVGRDLDLPFTVAALRRLSHPRPVLSHPGGDETGQRLEDRSDGGIESFWPGVDSAVEDHPDSGWPRLAHPGKPYVVAAVLLAGVVVGSLAIGGYGPADIFVKTTSGDARRSLGVELTRSGSDVQVTWNRDAPAITSAFDGRIEIWEGSSGRAVHLSADQLQTGRILYVPQSGDINVRLSVRGQEGTAAESAQMIRSVGSERDDTRVQPDMFSGLRPPKRMGPGSDPGSRAVTSAVPAENRGGVAGHAATKSAAENATRTFVPPPVRPMPARMPRTLDVQSAPRLPTVPMPGAAIELPAAVPWSPEGARKVGKNGTEQAAQSNVRVAGAPPVPARLLTPVRLVIPPSIRSQLRGDTVSVRVQVDEKGRAVRVRAADAHVGSHIINLINDASRQWRFRPALVGDTPVLSEKILVLRFQTR